MNTSTKIAIGAGAAIAAFFLLRGSGTRTVMTASGPVAIPTNLSSVLASQREAEIGRMMARGLTRAAAEARYDRAGAFLSTVASGIVGARSVSGLGGYYRG